MNPNQYFNNFDINGGNDYPSDHLDIGDPTKSVNVKDVSEQEWNEFYWGLNSLQKNKVEQLKNQGNTMSKTMETIAQDAAFKERGALQKWGEALLWVVEGVGSATLGFLGNVVDAVIPDSVDGKYNPLTYINQWGKALWGYFNDDKLLKDVFWEYTAENSNYAKGWQFVGEAAADIWLAIATGWTSAIASAGKIGTKWVVKQMAKQWAKEWAILWAKGAFNNEVPTAGEVALSTVGGWVLWGALGGWMGALSSGIKKLASKTVVGWLDDKAVQDLANKLGKDKAEIGNAINRLANGTEDVLTNPAKWRESVGNLKNIVNDYSQLVRADDIVSAYQKYIPILDDTAGKLSKYSGEEVKTFMDTVKKIEKTIQWGNINWPELLQLRRELDRLNPGFWMNVPKDAAAANLMKKTYNVIDDIIDNSFDNAFSKSPFAPSFNYKANNDIIQISYAMWDMVEQSIANKAAQTTAQKAGNILEDAVVPVAIDLVAGGSFGPLSIAGTLINKGLKSKKITNYIAKQMSKNPKWNLVDPDELFDLFTLTEMAELVQNKNKQAVMNLLNRGLDRLLDSKKEDND